MTWDTDIKKTTNDSLTDRHLALSLIFFGVGGVERRVGRAKCGNGSLWTLCVLRGVYFFFVSCRRKENK